MDEQALATLHGAVVVHDPVTEKWKTVGTSTGLSTIRLLRCMSTNTFRIHARKINDASEVVLDRQITKDIRYNRSSDDFIQWTDSQTFMGINFRKGDAEKFFKTITEILQILKQGQTQTSQQPTIYPNLASQQMPQTSSAIIQRSIQQQTTQQPQQSMMQQQQHLIMHQQQQIQSMMGPVTSAPLLQQPPPQQPNQPLLHQQQLHQHYMQQQPTQAQSHPNQSQVNHYQHPHQNHLPHVQLQQQQHQQQGQQQQQQPQQQQQQLQMPQRLPQPQQQIAPIVSAPVPPPPPPPPPAPPAGIVQNQPRINGTSNTNATSIANNDAHHPPHSSTNSNNTSLDANGTSPSQTSSLANELAKCQLKKVNISRSDSEKESECNNNIVGNPKNRAASLACDNLMNDLSKRLAIRRERLDQQGDGQSNNSNSSITNGTSNDKSHESWLADLIRKEISKEMGKMKAEILEAIRSEFKH